MYSIMSMFKEINLTTYKLLNKLLRSMKQILDSIKSIMVMGMEGKELDKNK